MKLTEAETAQARVEDATAAHQSAAAAYAAAKGKVTAIRSARRAVRGHWWTRPGPATRARLAQLDPELRAARAAKRAARRELDNAGWELAAAGRAVADAAGAPRIPGGPY